MYDSGQGVPQDDINVYAWINIAAANGNKFAVALRDEFVKFMISAKLAEA